MFDTDDFIDDCLAARAEAEPRRAVKEVLSRAVARSADIAAALPLERAEIVRLHSSPALTIIKVVWAPGMRFHPHDHRMWAAIAIYAGGEDNTFYRRTDDGLTESGGKALRPGDVCVLGDDTAHSVVNPTNGYAGAIHVYGGDFFSTPRSEWHPETFDERPYDVEAALRYFEESNASVDTA